MFGFLFLYIVTDTVAIAGTLVVCDLKVSWIFGTFISIVGICLMFSCFHSSLSVFRSGERYWCFLFHSRSLPSINIRQVTSLLSLLIPFETRGSKKCFWLSFRSVLSPPRIFLK